jgi:hypothetical protein
LYPFIHVRHVRFLNNATASNQGKETSSWTVNNVHIFGHDSKNIRN